MEETAARQVSEDETAARQMKMKLPPNFLLAAAQIAPRQRLQFVKPGFLSFVAPLVSPNAERY